MCVCVCMCVYDVVCMRLCVNRVIEHCLAKTLQLCEKSFMHGRSIFCSFFFNEVLPSKKLIFFFGNMVTHSAAADAAVRELAGGHGLGHGGRLADRIRCRCQDQLFKQEAAGMGGKKKLAVVFSAVYWVVFV